MDGVRKAALEAAEELEESELFLLVQSLDIDKGRKSRIFNQSMLRAPSIVRRIEGGRKGAKRALKALKNKGFLQEMERRKVVATSRGNRVKHVFDEMAREMSVQDSTFDKNRLEGVRAILARLRMDAQSEDAQRHVDDRDSTTE